MVFPRRFCSTVLLSVPATSVYVSTVTIESTIIRTTYVTVRPTATTTATPCLSPLCHGRNSTTFQFNDTSSFISSFTSKATQILPVVVTESPTRQPSPAPTGVADVAAPHSESHHKQAIIGGLAGAIAGLLVIGSLLCFIMRLRRKRNDGHDDVLAEKGVRPATARTWTDAWTDLLGRAAPPINHTHAEVSVDEHHHIIRMSLNNWARPFAAGQGESIRDSLGAHSLPLRVTNPDLPRPRTPGQASSETAGSLAKHPRAAFAAMLHASRSRSSSATTTPDRPARSSPITIDPNLSRECILGDSRACIPSSTSHPSLLTPPGEEYLEDPFATPTSETHQSLAVPSSRPRRPSLGPLHNAASRTLNHVGTLLSRVKHTGSERAMPSPMDLSPAGTAPSSRFTGYSDPFDLDKLSLSDGDLPGQLHEANEARSLRGNVSGVAV